MSLDTFATLTDSKTLTVHMLAPSGIGPLCGAACRFFVSGVRNDARVDDVTCVECWNLMMADWRYRRNMRRNNMVFR